MKEVSRPDLTTKKTNLKLTIHGAARQVTGSMHLLEIEDYRILVDCGLDYEEGVGQGNEIFPFDPASIDVVVLTHAHIDHSGRLPILVKQGFEGQILCTSATAELSLLLLYDSAELFLRKEKKKIRRGRKQFIRHTPPLYTHAHVRETSGRFVSLAFNKPFNLNDQIELTFVPAGHLLGAASAVFRINAQGVEKSIAFTGDVGRYGYPILKDPDPLPPVDYLVSESTYGGRRHQDQLIEPILIKAIEDACIKTPGKLIIPAFSVGRTQALVYTLNKLFSSGILPKVKVFVDSPLANRATEIFRKYHHLLNDEARTFYDREGDEFEFENLKYIENLDESKEISDYYEPCIIISSAGMLEGGRIQDHLFENLQNYYCKILFIGYCAPGTLGHRLLRGDPVVKIRNRSLSVYASIERTDALSGHADHDGLLNQILTTQSPESLKDIFLVHGEASAMISLGLDLEKNGYSTQIPERGEQIILS